MRIVVQRVKSASVTVEGEKVSSIGPGLVALVGIHQDDTEADLHYCGKKLVGCKLWENENGAMWRQSVKQKDYELLCVSQFTLYGTLKKKNIPDYKLAMKSDSAAALYKKFVKTLQKMHHNGKVFDGVFGAQMDVELINDGPVTIVIDSEARSCKVEEEEEGDSDE
jgi:D-aminoacyl-tRNA deacylase